ncbi:hypothetical protein AKJ43_02690 [candidate division MSBL1 archaeon SCGC-AAA261D19]|uniref:Uncharacterized protein n=6 Tax=candidate division MSBL1 TaxID=215777 RepID=A0A133UZF9_9EURY|nr:hypothetical protein AKJ42_02915 [candidate division MSBL1 archaeon SCGC-AAA261C02]KXB02010.1 hypothetical protein AKJ43_02690 [candidate division MSBL1 archaeon SCGC-AAA261D19]KXB03543.1 hypothetical protein AKJ47_02030 [candidate division MSBL1 archaeon SCGC-AAA261G05]KXB04717.1 hypothetical protein AKJ48_01665 [candidate division MSBL1 archaeon SCGC-AAA261O19]KXB09570.1 hypothetical protein AKJ46_00025 [candidate division MSBL1 archaeon SCGC-AAA833K04]
MVKDVGTNEKNTFTDSDELRSRFVIREEEEFEKLVEGAEELVKIREETGEPKVLLSPKRGSVKDRLFLYFLGTEVSFRLGLREERSVSTDELCQHFKLSRNYGNARVSDLHDENLIEKVDRGEYKLDLIHSFDYIRALKAKYGVES